MSWRALQRDPWRGLLIYARDPRGRDWLTNSIVAIDGTLPLSPIEPCPALTAWLGSVRQAHWRVDGEGVHVSAGQIRSLQVLLTDYMRLLPNEPWRAFCQEVANALGRHREGLREPLDPWTAQRVRSLPGTIITVSRPTESAPGSASAPRGFTRPAMERMLREIAESVPPAAEEEPDADYVQPEEPRQGDVGETFTITTGSGERIRIPRRRRFDLTLSLEGADDLQRRWRTLFDPRIRGSQAGARAGAVAMDPETQEEIRRRSEGREPTPEEIVDEHSVARTPEERDEDLRFVREFTGFQVPPDDTPDALPAHLEELIQQARGVGLTEEQQSRWREAMAFNLALASERQSPVRMAEIREQLRALQELAEARAADAWRPLERVVDLVERLAGCAEILSEVIDRQEILRDDAARAAQEIEALARSLRLELGEEPPKPKPRRLSDGPISAERFRGLLDEREEDA